jgi:hypothetical protein
MEVSHGIRRGILKKGLRSSGSDALEALPSRRVRSRLLSCYGIGADMPRGCNARKANAAMPCSATMLRRASYSVSTGSFDGGSWRKCDIGYFDPIGTNLRGF